MKKTTLLLNLIITFALFSQTAEQRDKIIQTYNLENINNSLDQNRSYELIKKNKINTFLNSNPKFKSDYFADDKHYILYDIIDNKPIYISSHNNKCAVATSTNALHPGGDLNLNLEGEGLTIGVWEIDYPLKTHVEFLNSDGTTRISTPDTTNPNPDYDFHATHVCGTVGASGVNSSAKGMAPKSLIAAYNSSSDASETISEHLSSGMLVSNHSYGVYIYGDDGEQQVPDWYPGCYQNSAKTIDQNHYNSSYYLMVASAGNGGGSSYPNGLGPGLDKLTTDKVAKNNLVVANANISVNFTPFGPSISAASLAPSSSQGPTDDGRIKPDITGRGTSVTSSAASSNSAYGTSTGTSMSSPNVAGSLLLLQEHYNNLNGEFMKSATLKGLACHTATDDQDYEGVSSVPYPGPDPFWGWGVLNSEYAAQTIADAQSNLSIIEENSLDNGGTYNKTINVSESQKLIASICWTDQGGPSQYQILNSTTPVLVNDLDLRIFDAAGNEYFPWKLDLNNLPYAIKGDNTVDNIERVEIDLPSAGQYTITVSHKGNLTIPGSGPGGTGGVGPQDYSLIVTGANMTLSDPNNEMSSLLVWPNPAKDFINFQISTIGTGSTTVSLVDIRGRKVYQNNFNSENIIRSEIKTSNFAKGIYILNIEQGNKILNKKVIIE